MLKVRGIRKMGTTTNRAYDRSRKVLLSGLTLTAAVTLTNPTIPTKVYATGNEYEWVKQVDHDLLGGHYTSVASSADGSHLIVGAADGGENHVSPLFISSDYGITWENVTEDIESNVRNNWQSVAISNDGQTMIASSSGGVDLNEVEPVQGKIVISHDGGDVWEDISPDGGTQWRAVAISGNGNKIAALADNDTENVYISNNSGDTWETSPVDNVWNWESVSISDDGSKILVGGENAENASSIVYFSDDGADEWEDISPDDSGTLVFTTRTAMTADGSKIAVSTYGYSSGYYDSVYVSTNHGADWTYVTPDNEDVNEWNALAFSGNGSRLAVLDHNDKMYISADDGDTWTEEDPGQEDDDSNGWNSIDFNANGSRVITSSEAFAYLGYNDGIDDSEASAIDLTNAESGKTIKLTTPSGTTITCHSAVKESGLAAQDSGYSYPVGLVDFCFSGADASNEITLLFVTDLKPNEVAVRKYNPTTNGYATVPGASVTETTHAGQHALQVTYNIVDNGPLDTDPDDGEIADPVGLGVLGVNAPNTGLGHQD